MSHYLLSRTSVPSKTCFTVICTFPKISARIRRYSPKSAANFRQDLHLLHKFANFRRNRSIIAKICQLLQKFANFLKNLPIFVKEIVQVRENNGKFSQNLLFFFAKNL